MIQNPNIERLPRSGQSEDYLVHMTGSSFIVKFSTIFMSILFSVRKVDSRILESLAGEIATQLRSRATTGPLSTESSNCLVSGYIFPKNCDDRFKWILDNIKILVENGDLYLE